MNRPEQTPDPIAELLRNASELSDDEKLLARESFLNRVDSVLAESAPAPSALHPTKRWLPHLALAAAALLALYVGWPSDSLNYQVTGATNEAGYIRTSSSESAQIKFSDHTHLIADPDARLRIVEVAEHGARVSLEEGMLHVHVTHEEQTAWNFVAGPFQVHVTGTRFDLDWDAEQERLSVILHEGSVNVEGYLGSGVVEVRAGQRFLGDARARTMQVHDNKAPPVTASKDDPGTLSTSAPPAQEKVVDQEKPTPNESSPALKSTTVKPGAASPSESWSNLISRGDFKKVVELAKKQGISACISGCGAQDLSALADAARYTGQSDLAEKSLLALRNRFATTSGTRATFLLGRLYESQGKSSAALNFYETALKQSPNGPFASESLAGKMRMTGTVRGKSAAASVARDYLRQYPNGVHASTARQLAQAN